MIVMNGIEIFTTESLDLEAPDVADLICTNVVAEGSIHPVKCFPRSILNRRRVCESWQYYQCALHLFQVVELYFEILHLTSA